MLCKYRKQNKAMGIIFLSLGIVSVIFGIVMARTVSDEQHNLEMLSGMLCGLGAAFIVLAGGGLLRIKFGSQAKLKQEEIELTDERNVRIMQSAYVIAATAAITVFATLSFVFVGMGYRVPGIIMIASLYVVIVVFLIAHRIYSKKM